MNCHEGIFAWNLSGDSNKRLEQMFTSLRSIREYYWRVLKAQSLLSDASVGRNLSTWGKISYVGVSGLCPEDTCRCRKREVCNWM